MKDHLLVWIPRVAGVLLALFIGMFALDAFHGQPLSEAIPAFLIHLIPSFVLLGVVALAWRWPLVGAVVFTMAAVAYAWQARRLDWILVIGGPLLLAGLLYLASWLRFRGHAAP